jgi:hypothetical protein
MDAVQTMQCQTKKWIVARMERNAARKDMMVRRKVVAKKKVRI